MLLPAVLGMALFFAALGALHRWDGVDTEGMSRFLLLLLPPFSLFAFSTLLPFAAAAATVVERMVGSGYLHAPAFYAEPLAQLLLLLISLAFGVIPSLAYRLGAGLPIVGLRAAVPQRLLIEARAPLDPLLAEEELDGGEQPLILVLRRG